MIAQVHGLAGVQWFPPKLKYIPRAIVRVECLQRNYH